ncbi:PKD domain-containing protein [Azohydromonas aeria]|uniref:PKD domain-containing protein n=1 Tax=Azohydromonas aeria TaxID=2590212 RepID=UPI0012F8E7BD|nr:PKD domain-containing protein [Azohydromonas aeria]
MTQTKSWALSALALALAGAFATPAAFAAGPNAHANPNAVPQREKGPFPQLNLPDREHAGQRAIDVLGDRLPEVAAWYGKSPDEFREQLLKDKRMRVDKRGRVFFVEEIDFPLPATPASAASTGALDGTLAPLDQTFTLHSKPGAKRTIWLNFKGAVLNNTAWNSSGTTITAPPFDTDGVPYSFSAAELERIQYIWQRVAEDFAPFDVNVTTEAVAQDLITRSGTSDEFYGTQVVITTRAGVYSYSCGGVAYLGVFDDTSDYYKPALVFYDALGPGSEKYVAEAISHEAGHNMGLSHDGTSTAGYYTGQGSGATGWAPIMGVGYYQPLSQWSKGEYTDASNLQDDYAVMQGNGLPLRADDHGDTAGTATVLTGTAAAGVTTARAQGVIGTPADVDVFSFAAAAGAASFTLAPAARAANLDGVLTLKSAAGTTLATANPLEALNATLSVTLPAAGTYTLWVQGTGKGDPLTTGYSSYGSLGQYALTASYPTAANQPPTAVIGASTLRGTAPLAVTFSGAGSGDPDGSIAAYDWSFGDGGTASGAAVSRVFSAAGSYATTLRVTDNTGLSASASVTVTVDAPVVIIPMRVADIAMGLTVNKGGNANASARVKVVDSNGLPVAGAVVTGAWSGLVSASGVTATTDASGVAAFTSASSKKSGSFVFAVTNVARSGYSYAAGANTETRDFIFR